MSVESFKGETPSYILADELERLRKTIVAQHIAAGQKASGRTAASLRVEVEPQHGVLFGRTAFGTLETGRKPGKVPANFTGIIKQWMRDKGISGTPIPYKTDRPHKYTEQERGDNTLAYFIARKIKNSGTSLYRQGGRADIYSNAIPGTTKRILDRLVKLVDENIESIKLNGKEQI
jgi:hypothetical protein